jgi:hypothetical protein
VMLPSVKAQGNHETVVTRVASWCSYWSLMHTINTHTMHMRRAGLDGRSKKWHDLETRISKGLAREGKQGSTHIENTRPEVLLTDPGERGQSQHSTATYRLTWARGAAGTRVTITSTSRMRREPSISERGH